MKSKTKKEEKIFELNLNIPKEIELFFKTRLTSNKPVKKELELSSEF